MGGLLSRHWLLPSRLHTVLLYSSLWHSTRVVIYDRRQKNSWNVKATIGSPPRAAAVINRRRRAEANQLAVHRSEETLVHKGKNPSTEKRHKDTENIWMRSLRPAVQVLRKEYSGWALWITLQVFRGSAVCFHFHYPRTISSVLQ